MNYFEHVQEGFVLTLEAFALVLVAICASLFYTIGAPFYFVSRMADRHFNRVNDEQIKELLK